MAYAIAELRIDVKDRSCADVRSVANAVAAPPTESHCA